MIVIISQVMGYGIEFFVEKSFVARAINDRMKYL